MIPVNTALLKERLVAAATEADGTLTHDEEVMQLIEMLASLTREEVDYVLCSMPLRPFDAQAGRVALENYRPPEVSVTCTPSYVGVKSPVSAMLHDLMYRLSEAVLDGYEDVGLESTHAAALAAVFELVSELGTDRVRQLGDELAERRRLNE